jgi:hypothetical protein
MDNVPFQQSSNGRQGTIQQLKQNYSAVIPNTGTKKVAGRTYDALLWMFP